MLKLKNADLNNQLFTQALETLDNYTGFTGKRLYDFNKMKSLIDRQKKVIESSYNKIVKKHCKMEVVFEEKEGKKIPKLNVAGKAITKPMIINDEQSGVPKYDIPQKAQKLFEADMESMMKVPFEVKIEPWTMDELGQTSLKPKELRACNPIMDVPEEEEVEFETLEGETDSIPEPVTIATK